MKHFILLCLSIILLKTAPLFAQEDFKKGDNLIRGGLFFSDPIKFTITGEKFLTDNISAGAKIQFRHNSYDIIGPVTATLVRFALSGNYHLDKKILGEASKYIGFPYAGLSLGLDFFSSKYYGVANPSETDFVFILQAGTNYMITDKLGAFAEGQLLPNDTENFGVGIIYKF